MKTDKPQTRYTSEDLLKAGSKIAEAASKPFRPWPETLALALEEHARLICYGLLRIAEAIEAQTQKEKPDVPETR